MGLDGNKRVQGSSTERNGGLEDAVFEGPRRTAVKWAGDSFLHCNVRVSFYEPEINMTAKVDINFLTFYISLSKISEMFLCYEFKNLYIGNFVLEVESYRGYCEYCRVVLRVRGVLWG